MAAREEVLALQAEVAQREEELSSLKQRLAAALSAGQESARSVPMSPLPPRAALSREASSKATLWMKTQNEGSLTPPCIVWKNLQISHTV